MADKDWLSDTYKKALTAPGRVLPKVQEVVLRDGLRDSESRDTQFLHPSEICKKNWCPRASWYVIKTGERQKQSYALQRMNVFAEGNLIHSKWQSWIGKAGILEGNWKCSACSSKWYGVSPASCPVCESTDLAYREVPIQNDEYHLLGHADGIINDGNKAVLEIKSVGLGTVKFEAPELFMPYSKGELSLDGLWKKVRTPFPAHIRQVSLYMFCLGISEAVVLYEWKPTQDVREFSLKFQDHQISNILDGCKQVKSALDKDTTVMRPIWATDSECSVCKKCDFNSQCWSSDANQEDSDAKNGTREVRVEVRSNSAASGQHSNDSGSRRSVGLRFDE